MSDALFEWGRIKIYQHADKDTVIQIFESLKQISQELKDTNNLVLAYTFLIDLGVEFANIQEVIQLQVLENKKNESLHFWSNLENGYLNTATLYTQAGDYLNAESYALKALQLCRGTGNHYRMSRIYESLYKSNLCMKNYEVATAYFDLYDAYKDSLHVESNKKVVTEMNTKYETDKKDAAILRLENENRISDLELRLRQEHIDRMQLEKLFQEQRISNLNKEAQLQTCQIEQNQVEAENSKKEADRKEALHMLEIHKQTQARNYMAGGLGLFLVLGFFVYNNYLTRQQLKLQKLRNKIASDLHDDVGSTLSSISIFSEVAQRQTSEIGPLLATINESSRKMLDAMGDIVWTINPENDQFEKIILRMRNFAFELLGAKKIDFVFKADEQVGKIKLPMEVRKNLYLIFKEATNNLAKYADATKAMILLKEEKSILSMEIWDDGKGFDINRQTEGNGLKNMRKRADEIGAKFRIDSSPGVGTTIHLRIAV